MTTLIGQVVFAKTNRFVLPNLASECSEVWIRTHYLACVFARLDTKHLLNLAKLVNLAILLDNLTHAGQIKI